MASEESLAVQGSARPAPRSFREGGSSTARAAGREAAGKGWGGSSNEVRGAIESEGGPSPPRGVLPEMPSERDPRACPSELGSAQRVLNNAGHTNRSANGSREILQMPVSLANWSVLIGPHFCRPPAPKRFTRCRDNVVPLKKVVEDEVCNLNVLCSADESTLARRRPKTPSYVDLVRTGRRGSHRRPKHIGRDSGQWFFFTLSSSPALDGGHKPHTNSS